MILSLINDFFFIINILQGLATRLSQTLNLSYNYCLAAINELQTNAIDKLKARDLFRDEGKIYLKSSNSNIFQYLYFKSKELIDKKNVMLLFTVGVATIKVRIPKQTGGGRLITIQSKLDILAERLYADIACKLEVSPTL